MAEMKVFVINLDEQEKDTGCAWFTLPCNIETLKQSIDVYKRQPSMVTKTSDSPKTGDNTNIYAYLAMLGLSCVGLGGMLYFKRRKKKS